MVDRETDVVHLFLPEPAEGAFESDVERAAQQLASPVAANDPVIYQVVLNLMHSVVSDGRGADRLLKSACDYLHAHIHLRYCKKPEANIGQLAAWQVQRVTEFVELNLDRNVSLEECALLVRLNRFHFARAFAKTMGMPLHRWQINRRVELARQLIHSRDLSLSEIATMVGCSDQSHLARIFKQVTGLTPASYRTIASH